MNVRKTLMGSTIIAVLAAPAMALAQSDLEEKQSRAQKGDDPVDLPAGMSMQVDAGLLSYDSNIFRTNDTAYFDEYLGQQTTPVVKSGFYFPLGLKVNYNHAMGEKLSFVSVLDLSGKYFTSAALSAANEYAVDFSLGTLYTGEQSEFNFNLFAVRDENTYYDRDYGEEFLTTGGTNLADKYKYSSVGLLAEYQRDIKNANYHIGFQYEDRDYDPIPLTEYDHSITDIYAGTDYKIGKKLKLSGDYEYSIVSYLFRKSRDAIDATTGGTPVNPFLVYKYHSIKTRARYRASKRWILTAKYKYQIRDDANHEDYNDYSYHEVGGNIVHKTGKWRYKLSGGMQARDYVNAFAFDKNTQPTKTYGYIKAAFKVDYRLKKWAKLTAQVKAKDVTTNDLRYDYERYQVSTGVELDL